MEILDEYSRFSARPFTSVTPLRASGGDGTKSVGVVFSIIDSALPPYTSALHISHSSQEVRIRTDLLLFEFGSYLFLCHVADSQCRGSPYASAPPHCARADRVTTRSADDARHRRLCATLGTVCTGQAFRFGGMTVEATAHLDANATTVAATAAAAATTAAATAANTTAAATERWKR